MNVNAFSVCCCSLLVKCVDVALGLIVEVSDSPEEVKKGQNRKI